MSGFLLYLILLLDNLSVFLTTFAVILSVSFVISVVFYLIHFLMALAEDELDDFYECYNKLYFKVCVILVIELIIFWLLYIFVPDTKQAVIIYVLPKLAENENIKDIGNLSIDLLEQSVQYFIDKLKVVE